MTNTFDTSMTSNQTAGTSGLPAGTVSSPGERTRAGLQQVLQVFITNSANVFLLEAPVDEKLSRDTPTQLMRLEEQVYGGHPVVMLCLVTSSYEMDSRDKLTLRLAVVRTFTYASKTCM